MGLFDRKTDDAATVALKEAAAELRAEIAELKAERKARQKELGLTDEVIRLKTEIQDLQIQKGRLKEDNDREARELKHMIGLEQKRQAVELEQGKKAAVLEVQQANLDADKARFEEQMDFMNKRFEKEVGYLKDIMGQVLERLPVVTVDRSVSEKRA